MFKYHVNNATHLDVDTDEDFSFIYIYTLKS